jgi:glutathione S-transferase
MKLYQFCYSPFAAKVRKCIAWKGLDCEMVEVPMLDRRALVAVTGGSIMIPVLEDGDSVISDSPRITAYLERYAPTLRAAPTAAIIESWSDNVVEEVAFRIAAPAIDERIAALNGGRADARAMFRLIKERKYGAGCLETWRAQRLESIARLTMLLAPVEEAVGANAFILGDTPTLADAAVYGQLYMIEWAIHGFVDELPAPVAEWYHRVEAAPALPARR